MVIPPNTRANTAIPIKPTAVGASERCAATGWGLAAHAPELGKVSGSVLKRRNNEAYNRKNLATDETRINQYTTLNQGSRS